jgi:hypothetical protein
MPEQTESLIFSPEFLAVDPSEVVRSIDEIGYFAFERAVQPAFLAKMQEEIAQHKPAINLNDAQPVWWHEQYFFPHALSCSKSYFQYVTAAALRAISGSRFGDNFRLKCHRYYETGPGHSMVWHADNVTNEGVVNDSNGLIFILYINDVHDGEFQLVSDSYNQRKSGTWSYTYTNEYIEREFADRIRSFRMPAGSLIVYDTYGIHRAKPIVSRTFVRKSIFFQVDQSDDFAEKLLLNPSFFESRDPSLLDYLGFGKHNDFPANPTSTVNDVPAKHLAALQKRLLVAFFHRLKYGMFHLLPHDTRLRYQYWKAATAKSIRENHPTLFRILKSTVGRFV